MIELKPCPFCGGKADWFVLEKMNNEKLYYVECSYCFSRTGYYSYKYESIKEWNRRSHDWISVKDRLPEDGESILIFVNNSRYEPIQYDVCYYDDDDAWLDSGYSFGSDVTHWMRLPEPPEMKGDE